MTTASAGLRQAPHRPQAPAGPAAATGSAAATGPAAATGSVHSWDLSTGVDGPGTRFVVFTAGCPLRCVYCHNPDTWQERNGRRMSAADVLARAARYRQFIAAAGGAAWKQPACRLEAAGLPPGSSRPAAWKQRPAAWKQPCRLGAA